MRWSLNKFLALSRSRSFPCHGSMCLSAVKVWDIIENRECSWLLSKLQTMFECFYKNIFTSKVSHSLDIKAQPKTLQPGYAKAYFLSYKQS